MAGQPWWVARAEQLEAPHSLSSLPLGALFRLREELHFVRDNVEPVHLPADFARCSGAQGTWASFLSREANVETALCASRAEMSGRIRDGGLERAPFRDHWQSLGYETNTRDAGTPADDFLDGLFLPSRLDVAMPHLASPNMASRARRVAEFLSVMAPGATDHVIDLGSGSGKLALTVSASTDTRVTGIELCAP